MTHHRANGCRQVEQGTAVGGGVACGYARVLERRARREPRRRVSPQDRDQEKKRLCAAVEQCKKQLQETKETIDAGETDAASILDAHLLMLDDQAFATQINACIDEGRNAEWAVRHTIDQLKAQLSTAEAAYLKQRAEDLEHIATRVIHALSETLQPEESRVRADLPKPTPSTDMAPGEILVAWDLSAADAITALSPAVRGLVLAQGSNQSHTAIIARARQIPAVFGVPNIVHRTKNGAPLIVDGLTGSVVVHPTDAEQCDAQSKSERYRSFSTSLNSRLRCTNDDIRSVDGTTFEFSANIDTPEEARQVAAMNVRGIGLFRTEFLYLSKRKKLDEDTQTAAYSDAAAAIAPHPIVFRTFDLGADKLPTGAPISAGSNPALGLRAIRLANVEPELFRTQLRAILRAAVHGNARIMLPLVTRLDEVITAKTTIESCCAELEREGLSFRRIPIGAMIEVPSAALLSREIAAQVDFLSIGTNDLVQYTLAVDRNDPQVAHLATLLHPAVLRLLEICAKASEDTDISICGDMAGDPVALPVAVGLGFQSLSIAPRLIPFAQETVRRLDVAEAQSIAKTALAMSSAAEVRTLVWRRLHNRLGDLWREQGVRSPQFDNGNRASTQ